MFTLNFIGYGLSVKPCVCKECCSCDVIIISLFLRKSSVNAFVYEVLTQPLPLVGGIVFNKASLFFFKKRHICLSMECVEAALEEE